MKKKIIMSIGIFLLIFLALNIFSPSAKAEGCPSGLCMVEINCTTGVVTYRDAPPRVVTVEPVRPEAALPTHTISVQTANAGWSTAGTPEQIAVAVASLAPTPITVDPCLNGGCTKVEINATTGVTTVLPLSETDLKQRAVDQINSNQRQAELAKAAYQALPNITAWQPYDFRIEQPMFATSLNETLTPEWWFDWEQSFNLFFKNWFWWWAL
jgi:hypothetical protein